ncbi:MAG: DNA methyltransferase [Planctomycetota bacterium]
MHESTALARPPAQRPRRSSLIDMRIIYCGDCLDQLRKLPNSCVDLIYIDPPFNSNRNYEVFWGETKEKRAFDDRHAGTQAYIEYMRPRCVELARVLKKTGSFYYHCDWHASHYVKVMLDQIFGENYFQNEICWVYQTGGASKQRYARKHDVILFYAKSNAFTFNSDSIREPRTEKSLKRAQNAAGARIAADDIDKLPTDVFQIQALNPMARERLGYPTQKPLALLDRIIMASSNKNDIILDAFCGCGTALVAAQNLGRQWIGIDISPTACRVMAKRLRDVCKLREDETLWLVGRGFVVRDLPWTEEKLRAIPPFEFENWAVIALGGVPNKAQVGDKGIDGRIYPVSAMPKKSGAAADELEFMDVWYPIQVKQKDRLGRPDVDSFEAIMTRHDRTKGLLVAFDYSADALTEIGAFFRKSGKVIVALTVREILDEEIARKLA